MKSTDVFLFWLAALVAVTGLCGWYSLHLKRESAALEVVLQPVERARQRSDEGSGEGGEQEDEEHEQRHRCRQQAEAQLGATHL